MHRFLIPVFLAGLVLNAQAQPQGRSDDSVFHSAPAPMTPRLREGDGGAVQRRLVVEERAGAARSAELVRVPLFFHEGECADPDALEILPADGGAPVPYQADDIRRDASGRVARMHLYFEIDLKPWERKSFILRPGTNPARSLPKLELTQTDQSIRLAGQELAVTFSRQTGQAGAITFVQTPFIDWDASAAPLLPSITLVRQSPDTKVTRSTRLLWSEADIRDFRWSTGPLFAKLIVRAGPKVVPDNVEYTYIVPRRGSTLLQSQRLFPTDPDDLDSIGAGENILLAGKPILGKSADTAVVAVPAGLRRLTRSLHAYTNPALVSPQSKASLLVIGEAQNFVRGIQLGNGSVAVNAAKFARTPGGNSDTLRAYWGQARYVFSSAVSEEDLWQRSLPAMLPLTAIVDEPQITRDNFLVSLSAVSKAFWDIKYWGRGWAATGAMLHLKPDPAALATTLGKINPRETDIAFWLPKPDAKPQPGKKDVGRVDPYGITYGAISAGPFARWIAPSEKLDAVSLAIARASRQVNAKTDKNNFPYIDCFATALNMQVGSYTLGIYAGRKTGDLDLARFYLDCARTPSVSGVFGHGQRPYTGNISGPGDTDLLYECLTDLYLRSLEFLCDEDLNLHPAVFARYFDAIDVNADLYQRNRKEPGERVPAWWRASMFRAQSHDHRWESWDAAPFYGIFAHPADQGAAGLTEAAYWMKHREGRKVNWSELMPMFLADVNLRHGVKSYRRPALPPLPANLKVAREGDANAVAWDAVPSAAEYRVYRAAKMGGPWMWLNSPYAAPPAAALTATRFSDRDGKPSDVYFVTAVDKTGRESRWYDREP